MKPWIGVLVSLLVATACLVACGDSDDGSSVRNASLLTSDTAEVKVSSGDDSKGDADYNDAVATFKLYCEGGDKQVSAVAVVGTHGPVTGGAKDNLG